jgi:hypothetical protein
MHANMYMCACMHVPQGAHQSSSGTFKYVNVALQLYRHVVTYHVVGDVLQ